MYCSKPTIGNEEIEAATRVLKSGILLNGPETLAFEKEFSAYVGTTRASGVSNGTAALILAMEGLGVGKGDAVLVPQITAFPTAEAVWNVGATPIPVPVDDNYIIDIERAKSYLFRDVKAVIVVHLYGYPADMELWQAFCKKYNLLLIEDCAQATGTVFKGQHVGSFGDAGCFSFYPTKNITVGGDGGMVVTNNYELDKYVKLHRNHCIGGTGVGHNFRLSEISAAIGREQLKKAPGFIRERNRLADNYDTLLGMRGFEGTMCDHSYHLYVIQHDNRDLLQCAMKMEGIMAGLHYPYVITSSRQKPTERSLDAQHHSNRCISLPLFVGMTPEDQFNVIKVIKNMA